MKFSLIALAGALTTANAASSVVPKTFKLNGKRNLRRGDASTEALLQKAVPYNRKNINRHLQEEDDAEAEQGEEAANDAVADDEEAAAEEEEVDVEPSSTSTISFGKCVDVKTRDEDLFGEDLVEQVQAGNVMSLKSYVIFNVCTDTYGYGCSESNSVEYMVDLSTYLSVVGLKQANLRTDYCEQCDRFQESCAAAAAEEEEEQAAYDEEAVDEEQEGEEEQGEQEEEEQADAEEAVDEEQEGEEEQQGEQEQGEQEQEQEGSKDEQEQEGEEAMDEQEQEQEGEQEQEQEQEGSKDQQEEEQEQGEQEGSKDEQEQGGEGAMEEQEQGEQEFEEEKEEQNAQAYEMANGGRKLKQKIDCNQCESLQCFADDAENGQADLDMMVAEWIEEVANCKATDQYVNGMQVYLGPICSDGLYFEIGAFLNEVSLSKVIYYFLVVAAFFFLSHLTIFFQLLSNEYYNYRTVLSTPILHRSLKSLLPNKLTTKWMLLDTQSTP